MEDSISHYDHLARKFPFQDTILINRRCSRIVRFDRNTGWQRARQWWHYVRMRLRSVLVRIALIDVRLGAHRGRVLHLRERKRDHGPMSQALTPEFCKNTQRVNKWRDIAERFIGIAARMKMEREVFEQVWQSEYRVI